MICSREQEGSARLAEQYNVRETAAFLHANGYRTIAAQFADEDLVVAPTVSHILQDVCRREYGGYRITVYVLADTTYNSLGVDEVASSHVRADCVVHYGRASLTQVTGRVPVYYVFPKLDTYLVDEHLIEEAFADANGVFLVFVDQVYSHVLSEVQDYLRAHITSRHDGPLESDNESKSNETRVSLIEFPELATCACGRDSVVGGYAEAVSGHQQDSLTLVWFGSSQSPAKKELILTYNAYSWISIHPMEHKDAVVEYGVPVRLQQLLRKRYFLVEKARNASIVGILVGTLGAAGYKDSIQSLRVAAKAAGKKTYTLLMGKPNPAKLANFPEIEIFVLVADPQAQILDSKEYYAPIITPYEAMIAFSEDAEWKQHEYCLNLHVDTGRGHDTSVTEESNALALQAQEALQISDTYSSTKSIIPGSSAEYLVHTRTWKGVDAPCAGSTVKPASRVEQGQHGRAAAYACDHEFHASSKAD